MTNLSFTLLSDRDLLEATVRSVDRERRTTVELLALLAELDTRKLYLGEGYSSLFTYCTLALHLSEPAAYSRITAARAARRFPVVLALLAEGAVTLTTVNLLAAHLTDENHEALLDGARQKSKRDVERLVACLHQQPDIPSSVRKIAAADGRRHDRVVPLDAARAAQRIGQERQEPAPQSTLTGTALARSRSVLAPITSERYLLKVTLSRETHDKFERARALLRHTIPNGDPAAVVDRAVTVLLNQLEKRKVAETPRPRQRVARDSGTRNVPAAVRRTVWARDNGRCAFVGSDGRCVETGFIEFHHVRPFAAGGATSVDNLELRCRAHNAHEDECYFGRGGGTASG